MLSPMYRSTFLAAITTLTIGVPGMDVNLRVGGVRLAFAEPAVAVKDGTDEAERIRVYFVSPSILGLRFETGRIVEEGRQQPYQRRRGDVVWRNGTLVRDGRPVGVLAGRDDAVLFTFDSYAADPIEPFFHAEPQGSGQGIALVDRRSSYGLSSAEDADYATTVKPVGVWRKSKVIDTARVDRSAFEFVKEHHVFLELPAAMKIGRRYTLQLAESLPGGPHRLDFVYAPQTTPSEAVHVVQTGFRPRDPFKAAYLSLWRGENAESPDGPDGVTYPSSIRFRLVSEATGQSVYEGVARLDAPAAQPTDVKRNYNLADVHELAFGSFRTPGTYRVEVEGVGVSFPFEIGEQVWERAFVTSLRGLFHQRSGMALGEPYTRWTRPRSLHPADGFRFFQSAATLMDTSMGLNLLDENSFEALAQGRTAELVPEAWGGWHDAGDFDRRIQNLWAAQRLLGLAELRPRFVERVGLSIPESGNNLPDTVDEALWTVDLFKRLQKADGGVPGGIESSGHPRLGESSWTESQDLFVYAPDPWSSYTYAATAARAAGVVARYDPDRAADYEASAVHAMVWAEAARTAEAPAVTNARNLAAVELYRLTGERRWHDLYIASSSYRGSRPPAFDDRQHEAAFVYARLQRPTDAAVRENGIRDILGNAQRLLARGANGGFGQIINPNTPYGFGYTSVVPADADALLIKAHELTGDPAYMRAVIGDALFGLGANPDNLVYTTGLGRRGPREVLVVDAEAQGKPAPPGITIFGQYDALRRGNHFSFTTLESASYPRYPWQWPLHEMVNGFTLAIPITEFSVQATLGPTAFVLGFIAATGPGDRDGPARAGSGG